MVTKTDIILTPFSEFLFHVCKKESVIDKPNILKDYSHFEDAFYMKKQIGRDIVSLRKKRGYLFRVASCILVKEVKDYCNFVNKKSQLLSSMLLIVYVFGQS